MAALVVAGGDGPKVLEAVDPTLDDIAALVGFGIKGGWTAAASAPGQAVVPGILAFRADTPNASALNLLAALACAISSIYA